MTKPVIDALDALLDIRAGMDDSELMAKYNLSSRGLQSLFAKLVRAGLIMESELDERPRHLERPVTVSSVSGQIADDHRGNDESSRSIVQVQAAVQDIRAGISDAELMQKYRLSAKGLQALFDHLITVSAINPSELRMRDPLGEETVDVVQVIHKLDQHHDGVAQESAEMPRTCIACGAPQTAEYEKCPVCGENTQEYRARKAREERMAHAIWTCPACGRPQLQEFDECPVCGVIVAKYKKLPPESKSTSA